MSLSDGTAWENEFGVPKFCNHEIANCISCSRASDDGPEVGVIKAILASHKLYVPGKEGELLKFQRFVDVVARKMFGDRYGRLGVKRQRSVIHKVVSLHVDGLRPGAEDLIVLEP